jgi:hypothetical protein
MTLKTLRDNLLWIAFFLCVATYVQARNEYLNDYGTCERGSWETYTELRQQEYKTGTSNEYQNQMLGFRFRMPLGSVCSDEYIAEMQKKNKIKTQLELIKECKRIPRINPPPLEFAELFNMCNKLGVVGVVEDKRPEGRHWDNLKIKYLKDNPDIIIMEQAIPNEIK